VVLVGYLDEFVNYQMDFSKWILIGLPISSFLLFVTYILITRVLFPSGLGVIKGSKAIIDTQLNEMGKMSREEKLVSVVFALTAGGWIFKNLINEVIGMDLLNDTVTAMSGGILMFIIPINLRKGEFLMRWDDTTRLPWGILILFGGGLTLAKGMESTGLIQLVGGAIAERGHLGFGIIMVLLIITMLFLTELMSNVALVTIFIPVVIAIAAGIGINPLIATIPVTMAASCAFMMPISTPPNAIVFSSGMIRMKDMIRAGFVLNIVSVIVLLIATFTLIEWVFGGS